MTDSIIRTVTLSAPQDRVWKALTDHEQFGAWFRVKLDGPFRAGESSAGHITHEGYEHLRWEAKVVAIEPMRRFAFEWHPYAVDPAKDYSGEPPTLVEFVLEPDGAGTRLTVTESGFDRIPGDRRDEAMRMNGEGWSSQMDNIKAYLGA